MLLLCTLGVAEAKKPKNEPPPEPEAPVEVPADMPRDVTAKDHLADAKGERATVTGTLKRVAHDGT